MTEHVPENSEALYVIVDHETVVDGGWDLHKYVKTIVDAGARFVQYRAKDKSAEQMVVNAVDLREIVQEAGGRLVINGRADVAAAVGADGVHLPADGLPVSAARRALGDGIVGCSTHNIDELSRATDEGADFATYSPVWSPISKSDDRETHGRTGLAAAVDVLDSADSTMRLYGLGGVSLQRVEICRELGVGAATIGGIAGADDPAEAVRAYIRRLS